MFYLCINIVFYSLALAPLHSTPVAQGRELRIDLAASPGNLILDGKTIFMFCYINFLLYFCVFACGDSLNTNNNVNTKKLNVGAIQFSLALATKVCVTFVC